MFTNTKIERNKNMNYFTLSLNHTSNTNGTKGYTYIENTINGVHFVNTVSLKILNGYLTLNRTLS